MTDTLVLKKACSLPLCVVCVNLEHPCNNVLSTWQPMLYWYAIVILTDAAGTVLPCRLLRYQEMQ